MEWQANPFDEYALEAALRLTENGKMPKKREGEVVEIISTEAGAHYRLKLRARDQFGEIKLSGQAVVREPRS